MRRAIALLALLVTLTTVAAQEYPFDATLYDAEEVTVRIGVSSSVTLNGGGTANELSATVYYVPQDAEEIDASPAPSSTSPLVFTWRDVGAGTYPFGYETSVRNRADRASITQQVPYPFSSPASLTQYLQPQEITDTNGAIANQANSLAAGKTDAFEVVYSLASWVHEHVDYDLSTVTAEASQKSSWVYANRYGVCDEITSLFISMSREAGIPARFVSGISYTNLPQFSDNFGPHGWAEVWLPGYDWIPVDVTYGQVGYVDATHIAVRKGLDAKNTAIDYSLLAKDLAMATGGIETETAVIDRRGHAEEPLTTTLDALYERTGSKSGNAVTASVTNDAPYYVVTELYLYGTGDTQLHDPSRQQLFLPPQTTRSVTWRVTMPPYQAGYEYTVPFVVLNQRAGNASTSVSGSVREQTYPVPPKPTADVTSLDIACEQPPTLYVGESASVRCVSEGNTLCTNRCSEDERVVSLTATASGAFPVLVTAKRGSERGSAVVTFLVEDRPKPTITVSLPQATTIDETTLIQASVTSSRLTDVTVTISGEHFSESWQLDELLERRFELRVPSIYYSAGENAVTVSVRGLDKNSEPVHQTASATITMSATLWERIELFVTHLFL